MNCAKAETSHTRVGVGRARLASQGDSRFSRLKCDAVKVPCSLISSIRRDGSPLQCKGMNLGIEHDWVEELLSANPADPTLQLGELKSGIRNLCSNSV